MKTVDQVHAKDSYSSVEVNRYFENLYARNFAMMDTPGFSSDLIKDLFVMIAEYR
jgi:hypothetical protein